MATEYIVTYQKKAWPDSPHHNVTFSTNDKRLALKRYTGMLEWQKNCPAIELKELKLTERTYIDKDITP